MAFTSTNGGEQHRPAKLWEVRVLPVWHTSSSSPAGLHKYMHSSLLIQQSLHYFCSLHLFAYTLLDATTPVATFIAWIYSSPLLRPHSRRTLSVPQARAVLLPSPCIQPQTQHDTNSSGWSIPPHLKNQPTTTAFLNNCKNVLGQVLKIEFSYGKLMLTKGWFSFYI